MSPSPTSPVASLAPSTSTAPTATTTTTTTTVTGSGHRYTAILPACPEADESGGSKVKTNEHLAHRSKGKSSKGKSRRKHHVKLHIRNKQSGCYVPKCILKKCNLSTHRHPPWMRSDRPMSDVSSRTSLGTMSIERALEMLPTVLGPSLADDEMKELFHQFFSFELPRLMVYFEPPSISTSLKTTIDAWRQERLEMSVTSPLSALVYICLAHIQRLVRSGQLTPTSISVKLYGSLLRLLRQKLESFTPSEADSLLLAIPPLVVFDLVLGHLQAIENHRLALTKLLHYCGIYNHHRSLSMHIIPHFDMLTATITGKPPIFTRKPDRSLRRPLRQPREFILGFKSPRVKLSLTLDQEVVDVCEDICGAIEILEAEEWNFQPGRLERPYNAANIQYMYFVRNDIGDYMPHLLAKDLQESSKSRPILLAALIVDYLVLRLNYLPFWSAILGNRLLEVLEEQDVQDEWADHEDILCWLMCVMVVIPNTWEKRSKALHMFGRYLMFMSVPGSIDNCSADAILEGICNPAEFVWSSPALDGPLSNALLEIEGLLEANPSSQGQGLLAENIWLNL